MYHTVTMYYNITLFRYISKIDKTLSQYVPHSYIMNNNVTSVIILPRSVFYDGAGVNGRKKLCHFSGKRQKFLYFFLQFFQKPAPLYYLLWVPSAVSAVVPWAILAAAQSLAGEEAWRVPAQLESTLRVGVAVIGPYHVDTPRSIGFQVHALAECLSDTLLFSIHLQGE